MIELIYFSVFALASFFRNNLYNRLLLLIGAFIHMLYILYGSGKVDIALLIVVLIFLFANGIHLIYYVNKVLGYNLSQRDLEMKKMIFDFMENADFKTLINAAKWEKATKDTYLIEDNTSLDKLILIYEGRANVFKGDEIIAELEPGNFAGEMSFMTGMKTNADVIVAKEIEYIFWERSTILDLMEKSETLEMGLYAVLNKDLITKLKNQNI